MGNLDPALTSAGASTAKRPLGRLLARLEGQRRPILAAFVGTCALSLYLLSPSLAALASTETGPPRLRFAGEEVGEDGDPQALALARRWLKDELTLSVPGTEQKLSLAKADLGVEVDEEALARWALQIADPTSPSRHKLRREKRSEVDLPPPIVIDRDVALGVLYRAKDKVDVFPQDARIDLDARKVLAGVPGRWLDIWGTLARIEAALLEGRNEVEAVVFTKPPSRTKGDLAKVEYDEVLGFFETRYSKSRKYEARTFNLSLAASKLDGHVLFPGEGFDFNEVVGPRDEANGYQAATVIAQGELVDGIGGGTCQISGTLHAAAVFSGLEIVERRPHTRPSSYIKMGLDAAVVYPTITLKLRNPFPYPVVLRETVKDGVVRAEVLGPKGARKAVTYIRKIDGYTAFQEIEREDPKLPKGIKTLAQRGIPGFRLRRYRLVRDGAFAERERWSDYYPPTTQIIRVGTGDMPKDSVKIANDPHPEYVADTYLMLMQGPEVENASGMVEVREAGESGRYGWTERAGFSTWSPGKKTKEGEGEACLEAACAKPAPKGKKAPEKPAVKKDAKGKKASR